MGELRRQKREGAPQKAEQADASEQRDPEEGRQRKRKPGKVPSEAQQEGEAEGEQLVKGGVPKRKTEALKQSKQAGEHVEGEAGWPPMESDAAAMAASTAEFFRRRAQREVFVRPLPFDATEADIHELFAKKNIKKKWLRGSVERVKLVRMESADAKMSAFVTFETLEDAQRCVAECNGVRLRGETLSMSFSRDREGAKETCMFFLEGKCTRGKWCKFAHPASAEGAAPVSGRRLPTCKFFAAGRCSRGTACKFSHVIEEDAEEQPAGDGEGDQDDAAQAKLRFDPAVSLPSLFEDEDVLAVNKPAGVLSHPSPGYWDGGTVAHGLVGRVPDIMLRPRTDHKEEDSYIPRAIVHRLDQGTTGVMVVAKTPAAERQLAGALRVAGSSASDRSVKKTYAALLLGRPEGSGRPRRIDVNAALGRDPTDPRRMAVRSDGRAASSIVHVHRHHTEHGATLATVQILTGRMHQIRVHCASLGAPIAGDTVYGDGKADDQFREALGILGFARRPLLHAWALELPHPRKEKEQLSLRAPLPDDMRRVIADLWPDLPADPSLWQGQGDLPKAPAKSKVKKRRREEADEGDEAGGEAGADEPAVAKKRKRRPPLGKDPEDPATLPPSTSPQQLKKKRKKRNDAC